MTAVAERVGPAAGEVKRRIVADAADGATALIGFAEIYAATNALAHSALILKLNYGRAETEEDRQHISHEMLSLVDAIVVDHASLADSIEVKRRDEAVQRAETHYAHLAPPRDVVFGCEGLRKTYGRGGFSLQGVSLTVRLGEITGVVGENANGKTTLFRLVAGDLRHDGGSMAFPQLGQSTERGIDWAIVKQRLAYVPQELPRWYGSLEDSLQYEAALHGVRGAANLREVRYIVERLELGDHLHRRWGELSGGFKLRFALARALVWKPSLLVIDEPLANLDFKAQQVLLKDLRDLASGLRYPMATLISSQHLHEIEAIADNILFLQAGAVTFNGPITALGAARSVNTFEIGAACDLEMLREHLKDLGIRQISHTGVAYLLRTSLDVTGKTLLARLLQNGVQVDYFRDISRSVKQLFK
jgi:ABC-type multidrug transport system ATPase subunit